MGKIRSWVTDYVYMFKGRWNMYLHKNPPKHYLGYVKENKYPIILIQGVTARWGMLKTIGDTLSKDGHPIYIVPKIGHHLKDIPQTAEFVKEIIDQNNLKNIVIIAHSKGGLVAKYLLVYHNKDKKIKKVIALSTPFGGTHLAKLVPHSSHRELEPENEMVKQLDLQKEVNNQIISMYPYFDNHVLDKEKSHLEGATNVEVKVPGHHRLLFDKETVERIKAFID